MMRCGTKQFIGLIGLMFCCWLVLIMQIPAIESSSTPGGMAAQQPEGSDAKNKQEASPAPQAGGSDLGDLAKQTQNPVGDLISLPISTDFNFNTDAKTDTQYITTLKPVIPFRLTDYWNLVPRILVPFIEPGDLGPLGDDAFGMGDITTQFFFTPAKPGKLIWGAGPQITFPTATSDFIGTGKYSAGPAAAGILMSGPWVYGALVTHQWSFAGDDEMTLRGEVDGVYTRQVVDRSDVNVSTFQPFLSYNLKGGWAVGTAPTLVANWESEGHNRFTVPVGGSISKTLVWGKQPMKLALQSYYNVARPDDSSNWNVSVNVSFLFPKSKKEAAGSQVATLYEPEAEYQAAGE